MNQKEDKFEKDQIDKGLIKYKGRWGTPEEVEYWKKLFFGLTSNFMDRTPIEFENFIGDLFKKMGYEVDLTPISSDFGADVIAKNQNETIAIQVKRNSSGNNVGVQEINQVLGSMHYYKANRSIVITTSDFTKQAIKASENAPLELWGREKLFKAVEKYCLNESFNVVSDIEESIVFFNKGVHLGNNNLYKEAIESYKWALQINPENADAWNNLGVMQGKLSNIKEEIECYNKCLQINPKHELAQNNKKISETNICKEKNQINELNKIEIVNSQTSSGKAIKVNQTIRKEYLEVTLDSIEYNFCYFQRKGFLSSEYNRIEGTKVNLIIKNISDIIINNIYPGQNVIIVDNLQKQYPAIDRSFCLPIDQNTAEFTTHGREIYNGAIQEGFIIFPKLLINARVLRVIYKERIEKRHDEYEYIDEIFDFIIENVPKS